MFATSEQNPLATERIPRLITRFSVPAILSMVVSALYNIVDQIFIGHSIGILGNAATNVAFPLTIVSTALALLVGVGGASGFNLRLGAGKEQEASYIAGTSMSMLIIGGLAISAVALCLLKPLLLAFGATDEVLPYAVTYTAITSVGLPLTIFATGCSKFIRADGSPGYSMVCLLAGAILNTALDPLFIFAFNMGIAGAAWATVIGQAVSCALAVRYLFHFKTVPLVAKHLRLHAACARTVASLGAGSCINQLAMMAVQITMNNTLTQYGAASVYGSEIPLACVGVLSKINTVFIAFTIGVAQGCQPIVSFNYGAGNYGRVKKTILMAMGIATGISVLAFLAFQLFPHAIVSIFGTGSDLYFAFAERYLRIYMLMTFVNGIHPVVSSFFTSIGKARIGAFISLTRQILFLLPLILIFPIFMGLDGVIYAGPIADGTAAALAFFMIYREVRQLSALEKMPD